MLRNLLIVSDAGIVLFSKEFVKGVENPSMVGGLVTAMMNFAVQRAGLPVSFIELSTVGVAIVSNSRAKVTCAVFYDLEDGFQLGQLIATEVLQHFCAHYGSKEDEKINVHEDFSGFSNRVADIIRNCVRPVLDELSQQKGIVKAFVTSGDTLLYSTGDVDKIGIMANVQALLAAATDVMAGKNDVPQRMSFVRDRTMLVVVRVERVNLVVVCKTSVSAEQCEAAIDAAASLLQKIVVLSSNLQDAWHTR